MKNKGFTIIEVLAVIVILGVLSGIVTIGVSRYRTKVTEKELVNLHSTIVSAFDNYRSTIILSGGTVSKNTPVPFCSAPQGEMLFDISYNGERLTCSNINVNESTMTLRVKGDLIETQKYINERLKNVTEAEKENIYITDGTCMITTERVEVKDENDEPTGEYELEKKCLMNNSNPTPSLEEVVCVVLKTKDGQELFNDYKDKENICYYFQ